MAQDSTSPVKTTKALDDYVLLGRSGLRVSPLCLGTMTFGETWGGSNKEESKKIFDLYYEKGGNFFDTACTYNNGESEHEVIAISKEINRSPVQVATNWIQQKPGITSPIIGAKTVTQLEENLKSLEFKLTPEQMKRLDDVSQPTGREIPFPYTFINSFDSFLGKNTQVPNKFASIATKYNFGRLD
ncbi:unnamed protein product [Rhizophagus irregularis]|nr:unnamed protein product [Rhizophagus irregularis]